MAVVSRDTRQTIVAAAAELFRKQGFAATTMHDVAEAAGISKGNLTYHFPSKQALFEEVHRQAVGYVRDRLLLRSFDEASSTVEGVAEFTRRLRRWLLDDEDHFVGCLFTNLAIESQHADPAVGHLARGTLNDLKAFLARRLEAGQDAGQIRTDMSAEMLSRSFFWMYEGALALSRAMDDPAEYDAFRAFIVDWLAP